MSNKSVTIPIEYEYLLSYLFGKHNFHAVTGTQDLKFLINTFTKIIKSIERSIRLNIYSSDQVLKDELMNICDNSLLVFKNPVNADLLNLKVITHLTKLIFMLLGQFPKNWDKRKTNFNKEWKLDKFRCVNYTSNYQQKTFLILENYNKYSSKIKSLTIDDLWNKLNYEFHNDHYKFISWFKENYFSIYKKII